MVDPRSNVGDQHLDFFGFGTVSSWFVVFSLPFLQIGYTPLHYTAREGHYTIAELLLHKGAFADARDMHGWTSLHKAAEFGSHSTASLLLKLGGAGTEVKGPYGKTALHVAAKHGHNGVVTVLLNHGARIEAKNNVSVGDW
jgi:ankyrin repeat protein